MELMHKLVARASLLFMFIIQEMREHRFDSNLLRGG